MALTKRGLIVEEKPVGWENHRHRHGAGLSFTRVKEQAPLWLSSVQEEPTPYAGRPRPGQALSKVSRNRKRVARSPGCYVAGHAS